MRESRLSRPMSSVSVEDCPARLLFGTDADVDGHGLTWVPLRRAELVVGRAAECAIRSDEPTVSRRHCRIAFIAGRWWVHDLDTANGTFVNERRASCTVLSHNDVIRCGRFSLRFALDAELHRAHAKTTVLRVR